VHAGFIGLRRFVARNNGQCKLIGNRFVIPHDTIPSNVIEYPVIKEIQKSDNRIRFWSYKTEFCMYPQAVEARQNDRGRG